MTSSTKWYLDSIERELVDLPAEERAELLEDLAAHFDEFASDDDLAATLGDPATYARELRDAAGLSKRLRPDTHVALIDRLQANFAAVRRSTWSRAIAAFIHELRPAWWVLRGWLIVAAVAGGPPGDGGVDFPIPRVADKTLFGLAMLMLVVPVSVVLGQQARHGQRKGLNVALTVLGALLFFVLPASANDGSGNTSGINRVATTGRGASTTTGSGQVATNDIWGYDSVGNAFLVIKAMPTQNGPLVSRAIVELQVLCPSELMKGPARALRTVEGAPIMCVGERPPTPTLSAPGALSPSAAPTTTAVPTTTTLPPATTITEPATTITEPTR